MINVFKTDDLWKAIIRPPKYKYVLSDLDQAQNSLKQVYALSRTDFELINKKNYKIQCSFWELKDQKTSNCILYLHGNSSSRFEAIQLVPLLLPLNISVFAFDFSGCGLSEGEYISLGWHEKDDISTVIDYIRQKKKYDKIILWGRSMGSVAAILYSAQNKNKINGLILDSPFCSLRLICEDIAKKNSKLPKCIMRIVWFYLKKKILKKAHFNINDVAPINYVKTVDIPGFFISAKGDKIVDPAQTNKMFENYKGEKIIELVEGDHNSSRPLLCLAKCKNFIKNVFDGNNIDKEIIDFKIINKKQISISKNIPIKKIDDEEILDDK